MLYHFNKAESLLHHVEMLPGRKSPEAVIYAPEGVDASTLQQLKRKLQDHGYLATPDEVNGKSALRLQHFGTRDMLFATLAEEGAVQGTPTPQFTPLDKAAHKTTKDKINENLVTVSGWGYLLGDALMALSGLLRKDWSEVATGAIWGSSGAVLAGFGKSDADIQMGVIYRRLGEHLQKEGIELPRNERELIAGLQRGSGLLTKTAEFFHQSGADIHHVVQATGGLTLIHAGLNQRKDNPLKMFQGISVAFGQGMGLNPERAKPVSNRPQAYGKTSPIGNFVEAENESAAMVDPSLPAEPDHRGAYTRVVDWFNNKPMRYAGVFSGINNLLGITGALVFEKKKVLSRNDVNNPVHGLVPRIRKLEGEFEHHNQMILQNPTPEALAKRDATAQALNHERSQLNALRKSVITTGFSQPANGQIRGIHAYQVSVATAFVYIAANAIYTLCSKNGTLDLEKLGHVEEIYAAAANVALHQPEPFRQPFIERVSTFLAEQKDLHSTADQIAGRIHHKLQALNQNPWADRMQQQAANENIAASTKGIA